MGDNFAKTDAPSQGGTHSGYLLVPELLAAVKKLAATEGWREAGTLIERHWDLYATTQPEKLLEAVRSLPAEAFIDMPNHLVMINYLNHVATGQDPRNFYELIGHGVIENEANLLDRLVSNVSQVAGLRTSGKFERARVAAVQGRKLLEEGGSSEELIGPAPHFMLQWGRAIELAEDDPSTEYQESYDRAVLTGQSTLARRAAGSLAWYLADNGHLNQAETWLGKARQISILNERYDAPLELTAMLLAIERRDYDSYSDHRRQLDRVRSGEYWAAGIWVRSLGETSPTEKALLEEMLSAETGRQIAEIAGANYRYVVGARAVLTFRQAGAVASDTPLDEMTDYDQLITAIALYRAGIYAGVEKHVARLKRADHSLRLAAAAELISAATEFRRNRSGPAYLAFRKAHAIVEQERMYSVYRLVAPDDLYALLGNTGLTSAPVVMQELQANSAHPLPITLPALSRREREILGLLTTDLTLIEIAQRLFISPNTIKSLLRTLYRKLNVHSREEAADIGVRADLH